MKKAGIGPVLTLLASAFSAQAASGALPDDAVGQPGGWRDVARPLVSSLQTLASEFSRNVLGKAEQARLKAEAQALLFASAQRPIAAVLDMDHSSGMGQSFLNNPYLVTGWKAQGKKAVFLELPESMQPIFNRFYNGETTETRFRQEISTEGINMWLSPLLKGQVEDNFIKGVTLLKGAGIHVYCVDRGLILSAKEERALDLRTKFVRGELSGGWEKILDTAFPEGRAEYYRAWSDIFKKRDTENSKVATAIKLKLHKGDAAVIVYGGGHFDGAWDLDEMIGKGKIVTITPFENRESYTRADLGKDPPHYTLIRGSGEFFLDLGGQMAGLPQFQPPDTHQPENPAKAALVSALRVPAPKR